MDAAILDPFSAMVKAAVVQALEETGRPLQRRLLNSDMAAEYLGLEVDAVKRMHASGKLPSVHLFERKLMFDVRDLDRVIEAHK